jgi:hypothetical protein
VIFWQLKKLAGVVKLLIPLQGHILFPKGHIVRRSCARYATTDYAVPSSKTIMNCEIKQNCAPPARSLSLL